jgi:hypothetical protein
MIAFLRPRARGFGFGARRVDFLVAFAFFFMRSSYAARRDG